MDAAWFLIIIFCVCVAVAILAMRGNQAELEEWNKKNKRKFDDYRDLKEHLRILKADKRIEEERKIAAEKKERVSASGTSSGSLTSNIARLNKLYKNGTLTKAEFEKAKNKLLK